MMGEEAAEMFPDAFKVVVPAELGALCEMQCKFDLILIDEVDTVVKTNRLFQVDNDILLFPQVINLLRSQKGKARVMGFAACKLTSMHKYGQKWWNWQKQMHVIPLRNLARGTDPQTIKIVKI